MCTSTKELTLLPPLSLFFFTDTATTEIYTLSLHDALPISAFHARDDALELGERCFETRRRRGGLSRTVGEDRKSTRLNSSHRCISYAVFCLKKKKTNETANDT